MFYSNTFKAFSGPFKIPLFVYGKLTFYIVQLNRRIKGTWPFHAPQDFQVNFTFFFFWGGGGIVLPYGVV